MTNEEAKELKVGDVVTDGTGNAFVVMNTTGEAPQAVALVTLVDPEEWEKVERE